MVVLAYGERGEREIDHMNSEPGLLPPKEVHQHKRRRAAQDSRLRTENSREASNPGVTGNANRRSPASVESNGRGALFLVVVAAVNARCEGSGRFVEDAEVELLCDNYVEHECLHGHLTQKVLGGGR